MTVNYTHKYNMLFSFSWASMYLVFPSWALPLPVSARVLLYVGFIVYFVVLSFLMNRWFKAVAINEPIFACPEDFSKLIKDNIGLLVLCLVAIFSHVKFIVAPIYLVGDEALFIQGGLWVFDYFGAFWHRVAKYSFWFAIVLSLGMIMKKRKATVVNMGLSTNKAESVMPILLTIAILSFLIIYVILLRNLPDVVDIRYPPLQKVLYLFSFFIVGINYIGPRIVQMIFYILSAVYLYKTINLLYDKKTALLGMSIFLFSPIIFTYAHFAELGSGVIFFIVVSSYYFLRFIIYQDKRGLLLSAYFIGTGFLYKRDLFLMFFICSAYLVLNKIKNREFCLTVPLKILSLPLFPIIIWLIIGKFFNWRGAWINLSNFTSLEKVMSYLLLIPTQISWILFLLFLVSIVFVLLAKRNHLSLYLGFLFLAFYAFYTSQSLNVAVDRFAMAFYPTVAVFLAILLSSILQKIKWKHSFKLVFAVLTMYLLLICTVPDFSEGLISFKNVKEQSYPNGKAMKWVSENVKDGEKVMTLRIKPDLFYMDKYEIAPNKIISFWYKYELGEISTAQKLREFSRSNQVTYVLFPSGPYFKELFHNPILRYLQENINNEFIEAASFNIDENYILIYKLKDS